MSEGLKNTKGGEDGIRVNLSGRLGAFCVDVEFAAPMRGITALFGASGCGKTTILRCMAGLQRLAGFLSVGGVTWQDSEQGIFLNPHERAVGYVFQEPSLFPHLSVRGNLLFGARYGTADSLGPKLEFESVVGLLGLEALLDRSPSKLSGGERQRVAVGRALLSQPKLLLMDEPLAALDHKAKKEILPYLETLHENLSIPIMYVSHDISEVARLADRVVALSDGKVSASGDVADIFERLDILGTIDRYEAGALLIARVVRHDEKFQLTYLDYFGQTIAVPLVKARMGEDVRLRVRARDVSLATQLPADISVRNILKGTIAEIIEDPATAYAEILIDTDGSRLRARVTRAAVADLSLSGGTPVYALIKSVTFEPRPRFSD